MSKKLSVKHLLGIKQLTTNDIELILSTADQFKEVINRSIKKVPSLRDITIANLFFENSTRTRVSFELAERRLSADTVNFAASNSSVKKGETILDTVRGTCSAATRLAGEQGLFRTRFRRRRPRRGPRPERAGSAGRGRGAVRSARSRRVPGRPRGSRRHRRAFRRQPEARHARDIFGHFLAGAPHHRQTSLMMHPPRGDCVASVGQISLLHRALIALCQSSQRIIRLGRKCQQLRLIL